MDCDKAAVYAMVAELKAREARLWHMVKYNVATPAGRRLALDLGLKRRALERELAQGGKHA